MMKNMFLPLALSLRNAYSVGIKTSCLLLLLLIGYTAAYAQTNTYTVTIAATGASGSFTTGYVNSGTVTDGNMVTAYSATSTSNDRAFAVFSLSVIPTNAVITSAKLTYSVTAVSGTGTPTVVVMGNAGNVYTGTAAGTYTASAAGENIYYGTAGFATATGLQTIASSASTQNFIQGNVGSTISLAWINGSTTRNITIAGETNASGVAPTLTIVYQTNNYVTVPLASSSFNYDLVANGTGSVTATTNAGTTFGGGYDFLSGDYRNGAYAPNGTCHFPTGGKLVSANTSGLPYQFASYTGNNALFLNGTATVGTVTPTTPIYASKLYLLGTGSNTPTTVTLAVTYQDGTTQTLAATSNFADWFTNGTNAMTAVGRVNTSSGSPDGYSTTTPYLHEANFALTDYTSKIASIKITNASNQEAFFALSAQVGSLSSTATSLTAFGPCLPSSVQTFSISGAALYPATTGSITATAPTGFLLSTNGSTWSSSVVYTISSSNTLASSPVYVKFSPPTDGSYSGNITFSGGTVNNPPTVAVSGSLSGGIVAAPSTTAAFGNVTEYTTASSTPTYTLTASGLAAGTVSVTSTNPDFQVSLNGTTWATSTSFSNTATVSQVIYIQYTPSVLGVETASVNVTGTALSCTTPSILCSGTGVLLCTNPATPTGITFTSTSSTGTSVSFTPSGTPDGYLLLKGTAAFSGTPSAGTTYSVGATIGTGTVVAVSYTSSPTYAVTGLSSNTTYYYTVIPFNGGTGGTCNSGPLYATGTQLSGTVTTCPGTPGTPAATAIAPGSEGLSWTSSIGGGVSSVNYSIIVATNSGLTATIPGSPFTVADPTLTYTVTGLAAGTTYYYNITAIGGCSSSATTTGNFTTGSTYTPLSIASGLNQDVIANGTSTSLPISSQSLGSAGFDGQGYGYCAYNYAYSTYTASDGSFPSTNIMSSILTSGLTWQIASYSSNNCDYMMIPAAGTITSTVTFTNPVYASNFYVLASTVIASGSTSINVTMNYADGTSSSSSSWGTIYNWFTATSAAAEGEGRINVTNGQPSGTVGAAPYMVQDILTNTYTVSPVSSISFAVSGTTSNVVGVFAVTAKEGILNSSVTTLPSFGSVPVSCNSSAQTFTIYGTQLFPAASVITASVTPGFQVSSDGVTWGTTATFSYSGGTMSNTTVYTRFDPTAIGAASGTLTFSGNAIASGPTVSLSGTGAGGVVIAPAATTAAFGPVTEYTTSAAQTYTISGSSLTAGTMTVTSSNPDFQVSPDGSTWGSSYSFAYGTSFSSTLYVQYTPTVVGAETSSISITGTTIACPPPNINCTGTGSTPCSAPALPTAMTISSVSGTVATVSVTPTGTPDGYLLVEGTSAFSGSPASATTYSVGASLGGGTVIFSTYTTVPTFHATGLTGNTNYYFTAIPFNGGTGGSCSGGPLYPSGTQLTNTVTTCPAAPSINTVTPSITAFTVACAPATGGGALPVTYSMDVSTNSSFTALVSGSPFVSTTATLTATSLSSSTTYYYRITAISAACNSTYTTGSTATTSFSYCVPSLSSTSGYTCGSGYYTSSIVLNGTTYSGTTSNCTTTNDLATVFTVTAGVPYNLVATTVGYAGIGMWADFGNDGTFGDLGDTLKTTASSSSGSTYTFSVSVTAPASLSTGTYRMRDICFWGQTPTNPCGTYSGTGDGDYHDFSVYVIKPTLNTSSTSLSSLGTVATCSTGASVQTFTINGNGLYPASGNIVATAPAGFLISLNGTTYSTTATYAYTGSTLSSSTVYVKFSSTVVGTVTGNITFSGGTVAVSPTVAVSGVGAGIALSPVAPLVFPATAVGSASPAQIYTVSGSNLAVGNITITSSNPDFQVSPDGSTWSSTYSFANSTTLSPTAIYIEYTPTVVTSAETGTITVSSPTGCTPLSINASGSCVASACLAPGTPTGISFPSTTSTGTGINFTASGSPYGYLVLQGSSAFASAPVNGTDYTVGNTIGTSTVVGVYTVTTLPLSIATTSSAPITQNTAYNITVIPFNGGLGATCGGGPVYATSYLAGTYTTCPAIPGVAVSTVSANAFTLNWPSESGALPVTYTVSVSPSSTFSVGVTGSPFTVTDPTTTQAITGLTSGTPYYYSVNATTAACSSAAFTGSVTTTTYCTPGGSAGCSGTYYTSSVSLNGSTWTGTAGACGTTNYTTQVFTVTAGVPYSLSTVTQGGCSSEIYVDFLNAGNFNATGDLIFSPSSTYASPESYAVSVTIPTTVATGTYRMRAIAAYNQGANGGCGYYSYYFDYKDFTLLVLNPTFSQSVSSLPSFTAIPTCSSSAAQTFTVSGTYLGTSAGSLTATAPVGGFQLSLNGSTWSPTVSLPYNASGTMTATPVYVNFTPSVVGSYSGNISITGGVLTSARTVSVSATSAGISVAPSSTAFFGPVAVSTTSTPITYTVTGVYLTPGTTTIASSNPDFLVSTDGVTYYNTSTSFSNTATISGQTIYIEYSPTVVATETATITVTSPTGCTLSIPASGSGAVSCGSPGTPTGISFSSTNSTGTGINFTASGSPDGYIVLQGSSAFSGTPATGTTYAVGNTIGTATVVGVYTMAASPLTITSSGSAPIIANTAYNVTVIPFNGGAYGTCTGGPVYAASYLSGTYTTCPAVPTGITSSGVTGSSFVLNWTAPVEGSADALTYGIDVSTDNTFATGVSSYVTAAITYTVPVSYGSTTYYYRVHSITAACNSSYSTTGNITTSCGVTPLPYTQGFESITSDNTLPSCMSATNLGGANTTWTAATGSYNQTPHSGSKFASFYYYNSSTFGDCNDWFFTPEFNFIAGYNYQVSFWYITDGYTGWLTLKAGYGASQSAAGMTNTVGTPLSNVINTTYAQYTGTFTATSTGNNYVGIYCNSNSVPYYLTIDDISVTILPTLVASPNPVTVGSVSVGYPGVTSYSLSGTGLTGSGNITVTAPASYLVSTSSSSGFASSITVPYTSGALASTPIYVQFTPTVTGTVSGSITCTGGGTTINVPVSGVGMNPLLTVAPSTLNMGPSDVSVAAPVQAFSVSGAFLTGYPSNVTLTSPSSVYLLSNSGSGPWTSSVTVPYTSGTLTATPIYVQFTPTASVSFPGTVTLSGGGALTTPTVTLTGNGAPACSAPSGTPTSMVFTGTAATTTTVGFTTSGTPDGYLLIESALPLTSGPVNTVNYTTGNSLGGGTVVGSYTSLPTYAVTGLTGNTQYYFTIVPFNGGTYGTCGGGPLYGSSLSANMNTCPATPGSAVASSVTSSGFNLSWTSSLGGAAASSLNYTIDVSTNNTFTAPITGSPFTVTDPTTSIIIGGLATATTYYYRVTAVGVGTCSSPATATGSITTTTYNYNTLSIASGLNEDIIANGSANPANGTLGVAGTSTGSYVGFDNADYAFISSDYSYSGNSPVTGQSLPVSGLLTGTLTATSGLTYQLAGYSADNALVLAGASAGNTGTLTLTTPQYANSLYFLASSGSGISYCTFAIHYADGTIQTSAAQTVPDWYTGGATLAALGAIGRVNVVSGSPDPSSTTGPYLYQLPITPTDYNSKVTSVVVTTTTGGTGYLGVLAMSARTGALYPSVTSLTNFGSVNVCSSSSSQTFTIAGSSLFPATTGTVIATAPAGFQLSKNGTTWASSLVYTVSGTSTIASTTLYVKFLPVAGGAASGNITFVGAGINNAPVVAVSGTGVSGAVTGTTTVCQNATTPLADIVTGGTWTSASPLVATVNTGGVVTGLTSGTAVISYTYGCVSTVNTATVTVNPTPSTTGPTYGPVCSGGTLALLSNATGATSYSWSGPATLTSNTVANPTSASPVDPTADGVYTVTLSNSYGCSVSSVTPSVVVAAQPSATVTPSSVNLCTGSVETLTSSVSGGAGTPTYTWSGPGITGTTATTASTYSLVPSASSGTYSLAVSYSVSTGCATASAATATVNVTAPPVISSLTSSVTNICSGSSLTLTASESGGSGSPVYTWKGPGISTTTSASPSLVTTPTVSTSASGAYSVSVSYGGTGCGSSAVVTSSVVTVNVQPTVSLSASPLLLCSGSNLTLTTVSAGGSGTPVYTWSGPGIATVTGSSSGAAVYTPTTSVGAYTVSVSYSGYGCNVVAGTSSVVTVNDQPVVAISASIPGIICTGLSEDLSATITDGGAGSATYTWSGPGISGSAGPYTSSTYTVTPASGAVAGVYSVVVTYSVSTGCTTATNATALVTPTGQQWTGSAGTAWSNSSNWACGTVPTATENVTIPPTTNAPTLDVAGYTNNLTINSTAVLTLGAGNQLNVAGNIVNNATVNGSGVIYLNGSSAQSLSGNGVVSNMTLANSSGATISTTEDTVGITGVLLLNSGTLTTAGGTHGTLMLVSNIAGSGSIGQITSGSLTGAVVVQQYIPAGRRAYRFIGHPFNAYIALSQIQQYIDITGVGGATNGFTTTTSEAPSAFWYNTSIGNSSMGTDPGWTAFTSTSAALSANQFNKYEGIRLFFRGAKGEGLTGASYTVDPVTYRMYGTVNTGTQNITMVKGSGSYADYNLIGNPYPSPVDVGTAITNAGSLVTGGYFYVWDPYLGTSGQFVTKGIGYPYNMGTNESFEVRTAANGNVLTFTEANKTTVDSAVLMRTASEDNLDLNIYDNTYHLWDMLIFKFNDAATDNEDARYDGAKPPSPAALNFYSWSADNVKLAADVRPFTSGKVIALGISSSYAQEFIIKADNLTLSAGEQLYLHDKYLQTYTLLQQGTEYPFSITKDPASQGDKRFELSLNPSVATQSNGLDVQMVPNPANSVVTISYTASSTEQTSIRVMNVEGITVLTQDLGQQQSGSTQIALDKLASGVYMVEFTSGTNKVVHRLVKE